MNTKQSIQVIAFALALTVASAGAAAAQGQTQTPGACTTGVNCATGQQTRPQPPAQGQSRQGNPNSGRGRQGHGAGHHRGGGQGGAGSQGRGAGGPGAGNWETMLPPATDAELTQEMIDAMTAGIMDEYHAQAVYEAVIDEFGAVRPFVNIVRAEEQHAAAWAFLFERYGLEVPAAPENFDIPEFTDVSDACAAGAAAEVANFDLYDTMLETFDGFPDVQQVAQSLRDASEFNHLPAFERCATPAQ